MLAELWRRPVIGKGRCGIPYRRSDPGNCPICCLKIEANTASLHLRVRENLIDSVNRSGRDANPFEIFKPLPCRPSLQEIGAAGAKLNPVRHAGGVRGIARISAPLFNAQHATEFTE